MITTSIERLEQIELERFEVMANPAYQAWMKELNVSQSYVNQEPRQRAKEMMSLWTGKAGELNSFTAVVEKIVARMELSSYL